MAECFYIYKITNLLNGKSYVGQRVARSSCPEKDSSYWGGGRDLRAAIYEYGIGFFAKEILWQVSDRTKLDHYEKTGIMLYKTLAPRGYNLTDGSKKGWKASELTRARLSSALKGRKQTEEQKRATSIRQTGKKNGNNGFPLYISKGKRGYHVKVLKTHVGNFSTVDLAIKARDIFIKSGKAIKEPYILKISRGKFGFAVKMGKKYISYVNGLGEAEKVLKSTLDGLDLCHP